ncbi:MAG: response regulator [Thermoplasmatota archaeon]
MSPHSRKKRILFVDDEADQLFSVEQVLKHADKSFEFYGAASGEKCFSLLKEGLQPDVILLDIMMPQKDGWEIYDQLRDNPKWTNIPIIFLTARADRIAHEAGSFLGEDYLEKPVDEETLVTSIEKVLKNHQ